MTSTASERKDEGGNAHDTDIAAALESLVDRHEADVAPNNTNLPPRNGMLDFLPPTEGNRA